MLNKKTIKEGSLRIGLLLIMLIVTLCLAITNENKHGEKINPNEKYHVELTKHSVTPDALHYYVHDNGNKIYDIIAIDENNNVNVIKTINSNVKLKTDLSDDEIIKKYIVN